MVMTKKLYSKKWFAFITQSGFIKINFRPYSIVRIESIPWISTMFKSSVSKSEKPVLDPKKLTVLF